MFDTQNETETDIGTLRAMILYMYWCEIALRRERIGRANRPMAGRTTARPKSVRYLWYQMVR